MRLRVAPVFLLAMTAAGACSRDTANPFVSGRPSVAPTAQTSLIFVSNLYATVPGAARDLYGVAADGSGLTRLTYCNDPRPCDTLEASLASDRRRVAVRRISQDTNGDRQLTEADGTPVLVLDLQRNTAGQIVPATAKVSGIDWSPAEDLIVYTGAGLGVEDLFTVDGTGKSIVNVTSSNDLRERRPRIDPSGSAAVFERIDSTGKGQVWFISTRLTQVTTGGDGTAPLPGTPYVVGSDADPCYSPDGRSVAFRRLTATGNGGLGTWDIMTALLNGSALTVVATGPRFRGAPDWGAQGLAFVEVDVSDRRPTLVVMNPDGSNRRTPVTAGAGFDISNPRWLR